MRKFELLGQSHGCRMAVQVCPVTIGLDGIAVTPEGGDSKGGGSGPRAKDLVSQVRSQSHLARKNHRCKQASGHPEMQHAKKAMCRRRELRKQWPSVPFSLLCFCACKECSLVLITGCWQGRIQLSLPQHLFNLRFNVTAICITKQCFPTTSFITIAPFP